MQYTLMSKEKNKQANFRLPEPLLDDLQKVADKSGDSQTDIVKKAVRQQVNRLKNKYNLNEKAETVAV